MLTYYWSGQVPEYDPKTDEVVLKFKYDFETNKEIYEKDPITVNNAFGKLVGALVGDLGYGSNMEWNQCQSLLLDML